MLDQSIIANDFGNTNGHSAEIMSLEQFQALHDRTWEMAQDKSLPFSTRLQHSQRYLMQGILAFGCLRAREDLAECRTDEFVILSSDKIEFEMKRNFKSHKITSDKKVVHKPSRYILGPRYVQVLQLIITHRPVFDDNAASPTAAQKPKNTKKLAITARKPKNSKPGGIKKKITPPDCRRLWLRSYSHLHWGRCSVLLQTSSRRR